jgi:hypothetical protein
VTPFTDKYGHGYVPRYLEIAKDLSLSAVVCELGVMWGESLKLWQSMFPAGTIIGVDRAQNAIWPEGTKKILSKQDDPLLYGKLSELAPDGIDLLIDDCSHYGKETMASWKMLWPLVKPGGFYVIEDWFVAYAEPWMSDPENPGYRSMNEVAEHFLGIFAYPKNKYRLKWAHYEHGLIVLKKKE